MDWYNRQPIKPSRTRENLGNYFINNTFLYKVSILYTATAPVHWTSFHRRKDFIHRSLHKTSFANEKIPDPKFCRNDEMLQLTTCGLKDATAYFTKKDPAVCFKQVLLVLNENKISQPKGRGRAFETRGWLFKHAAECFDLICLKFCLRLKTKQNVLICHGTKPCPRFSHFQFILNNLFLTAFMQITLSKLVKLLQ